MGVVLGEWILTSYPQGRIETRRDHISLDYILLKSKTLFDFLIHSLIYSYLVLCSIVYKLLSTYLYTASFTVTLISFKSTSMVPNVYNSLLTLYFHIDSYNYIWLKSGDLPYMDPFCIVYHQTTLKLCFKFLIAHSRNQPSRLSRTEGFHRMQEFQCWT